VIISKQIEIRDHGIKSNGADLEVPGRSAVLGRHNTRGEGTGPTLTGLTVVLIEMRS